MSSSSFLRLVSGAESAGSSVPGLEELRCVESVVPCLRDLGTGLGRLKILWLPRCALRDLDGLPSLSCLQVKLSIANAAIIGFLTMYTEVACLIHNVLLCWENQRSAGTKVAEQ